MAPSGDAPSGGREPAGPEPAGPERWLAPYFRDSTLWPVLAVATASVDRNLYAAAALTALAWMSSDALLRERRARGRVGLAGRSLAALWALGAAAALAVWRAGLF
jgi:hypothetical protein